MASFKNFFLYLKYRNKKFKDLGVNLNFKQKNSKFLHSQNIILKDNCKILDYAYFDGVGGITIGRCTIVAPKCTILTSNHKYDEKEIEMLPFNNQNIIKEVIIGDYCWIGRSVIILPGVKIGKASIVAAGSVVTKNVEPYSVVGGNPAKVIKYRDKENIDVLIRNNKCWSDPNVNIDNKKIYLNDNK